MKKEFDHEGKKILLLLLAIAFFIFIFLVISVVQHPYPSLTESKISVFVKSNQLFPFTQIASILSSIFEPAVFIIFLLFISIYLFKKKRKREAVSLVFFTVLSFAIGQLIKIIVQRPRPSPMFIAETGFSFPSSHALMAVIFFGTLIYMFEHHLHSARIKSLLIGISTLIILLIGLSRIYLNVHWLIDVIAGFALGSFLFVFYVIILSQTNIISKS